jgi:hypothetical protein
MNFEQSAEFIINIRPVHFSVRACYKTVKRYVHKGNYFSHKVLFFIVVQKANSFHDAVMRVSPITIMIFVPMRGGIANAMRASGRFILLRTRIKAEGRKFYLR